MIGRIKKPDALKSNRPLGVLESDSDADDDVLPELPVSPILERSPKIQPTGRNVEQETAMASTSGSPAIASTSNTAHVPPLPINSSPMKRLATAEESDGTDDEAPSTSAAAAGTNIDMQHSLFRSSSERQQSNDGPIQAADRPKKKQKLQTMIDDLFSL